MNTSIYDEYLDLQMYLDVSNTLGLKGKYLFDFNEGQEASYFKVDDFLYLVRHPNELTLKQLRTVGLLIVDTPLFSEDILSAILDVLVSQSDVFLEVVAFYGFKKYRDEFANSLLLSERTTVAEYIFALTPMLDYEEYHFSTYNMLNCIAACLKDSRPDFRRNPRVYSFLAKFSAIAGAPDFVNALDKILRSVPKVNSTANNQLLLFRFSSFDTFYLHYCVFDAGESYARGSRKHYSFAEATVLFLCTTPYKWSEEAKELFSLVITEGKNAATTILKKENWEWVYANFGVKYPRLLIAEANTSFYKERIKELSDREKICVLPSIVNLNKEFLSFALTKELKKLFSSWEPSLASVFSDCKKYLEKETVAVMYYCTFYAGINDSESFDYLKKLLETYDWNSKEVETIVRGWRIKEDVIKAIDQAEFFKLYEKYVFYYLPERYSEKMKESLKTLKMKKPSYVVEHEKLLKKLSGLDLEVVRLLPENELTEDNLLLKQYGRFFHVLRAALAGADFSSVKLDLKYIEEVLNVVDCVDWDFLLSCINKVCEIVKHKEILHSFFRTVDNCGWEYFDVLFEFLQKSENANSYGFYLSQTQTEALYDGTLLKRYVEKDCVEEECVDQAEIDRVRQLCAEAEVEFDEELIGKFPWDDFSIKYSKLVLYQDSKIDLKTAVIAFCTKNGSGIHFCRQADLDIFNILEHWERFLEWFNAGIITGALQYRLNNEKEEEIFWRYLHSLFLDEFIPTFSGMRKIDLLVGTKVPSECLSIWYKILCEKKKVLCDMADIDLNKIVTDNMYAIMCTVSNVPVILASGVISEITILKEVGLPVYVLDDSGDVTPVTINTGLVGVNHFPWCEEPIYYDRVFELKCIII